MEKFKASSKAILQFSKDVGIVLTPIRDLLRAYNNMNVAVAKIAKKIYFPGVVPSAKDYSVSIVTSKEIAKILLFYGK